jgi:rubrerythrin
MMEQQSEDTAQAELRFKQAYQHMLERVRHHQNAQANLSRAIELAQQEAVQSQELTAEEAEQVGHYLHRDLQHAGGFLAKTGQALRDWFNFDLELVEDRLLDLWQHATDQARVELGNLQEDAPTAMIYHSGEITGPGTLFCLSCGYELRFQRIERIPSCPRCHGNQFKRADLIT